MSESSLCHVSYSFQSLVWFHLSPPNLVTLFFIWIFFLRFLCVLLSVLLTSSCPPLTRPHVHPGKSNPYCEVTMGAQIFTSRTLNDTLNPKWNFNCQFHIKDVYQDVLCITVFEKDQFSPDGQSPAHIFPFPCLPSLGLHLFPLSTTILSSVKTQLRCSPCVSAHLRLSGSDRGARGNHKERVGKQGSSDTSSSAPWGSYRGSVDPPRPAALWQQIAAVDELKYSWGLLPTRSKEDVFLLLSKGIRKAAVWTLNQIQMDPLQPAQCRPDV